MSAIDACMKRSRTKEDFIKNMEQLGYGVKWTDTRKAITYHCPNGKDCRDFKLHEEKYLKGSMENEFNIRRFETTQSGGSVRAENPERADISDRQPAVDGNREPFEQANADASAYHTDDGVVGDNGRNMDLSEPYSKRDNIGAEENDGGVSGVSITGWEAERAELDRPESLDGYDFEPIQGDAEADVSPDVDMGDILGDAVSLGHNLSKIGNDYTPKPPKRQNIKEHKRGIGQKKDDHSGDEPTWQQTM